MSLCLTGLLPQAIPVDTPRMERPVLCASVGPSGALWHPGGGATLFPSGLGTHGLRCRAALVARFRFTPLCLSATC